MKKCPNCDNVIRNVAMRCDACGHVFGKIPKNDLRKHKACGGTGWLDYPVCLSICMTCKGTGYIRV